MKYLRPVMRMLPILATALAALASCTPTATLDPGAEITFDAPFGTYLAPGVHRLDVRPCCGGELWLKEGSAAE